MIKVIFLLISKKKNHTTINNKIILKKENENKINFLYKTSTKYYNNKRKQNENTLTFIENNLDIRSKIFNYLNKKEKNEKLNNKNKIRNKIQNKLYLKPDNFNIKKYYNTISTNNTIFLTKKKHFQK